MNTIIENILTDFVNKTSEHFHLDFEEALAIVSQSKVANDLVAFGNSDNRSVEDLCAELFDEISNGY